MKGPEKKGKIKLFGTTLALIFIFLAFVVIMFIELLPRLFTRIR